MIFVLPHGVSNLTDVRIYPVHTVYGILLPLQMECENIMSQFHLDERALGIYYGDLKSVRDFGQFSSMELHPLCGKCLPEGDLLCCRFTYADIPIFCYASTDNVANLFCAIMEKLLNQS